MSLMRTLAKVAIGVAVAKGASSMMKKGAGSGGAGGGLGGLLGGLAGGAAGAGARTGSAGASGGLDDVLGGLLGGKGGAGGAGGLGGLLEGLAGGGAGGGKGLQDMLGGLAGAAGAGGLLGGLAGGLNKRPAQNDSGFGQVLNSQFEQTPEPAIEPTADQEAMAALLLRGMIQAAKADGELDAAEEKKLMGHLESDGDVDETEIAFVRGELSSPVDVDGLVRATPQGMGPQVYAMSLLGIDLDSQAEAQHLHKLAQGYGLKPEQVNDIHAQLGVPSLYT